MIQLDKENRNKEIYQQERWRVREGEGDEAFIIIIDHFEIIITMSMCKLTLQILIIRSTHAQIRKK